LDDDKVAFVAGPMVDFAIGPGCPLIKEKMEVCDWVDHNDCTILLSYGILTHDELMELAVLALVPNMPFA